MELSLLDLRHRGLSETQSELEQVKILSSNPQNKLRNFPVLIKIYSGKGEWSKYLFKVAFINFFGHFEAEESC